jgi:hypothetical protein
MNLHASCRPPIPSARPAVANHALQPTVVTATMVTAIRGGSSMRQEAITSHWAVAQASMKFGTKTRGT